MLFTGEHAKSYFSTIISCKAFQKTCNCIKCMGNFNKINKHPQPCKPEYKQSCSNRCSGYDCNYLNYVSDILLPYSLEPCFQQN